MPDPDRRCEHEEDVVLLHYGELDADAAVEMEAHLETCPACGRFASDVAEVGRALDRDLVPMPTARTFAACREAIRERVGREPTARRGPPRMAAWIGRAAAAVLLLAAGFGLAVLTGVGEETTDGAPELAGLDDVEGYVPLHLLRQAREAERLEDARRIYCHIVVNYPETEAARRALSEYDRVVGPDGMVVPSVMDEMMDLSDDRMVAYIPEAPDSAQVFALRQVPERADDPEIRAYAKFLEAELLRRMEEAEEARDLYAEVVALVPETPLAALATGRVR